VSRIQRISAGEPVAAPPDIARLIYVTGEEPGIRRRRAGKGFSYIGADGRAIRDSATLARIRALAIPPAYADVWIAADPNAHIQATGRDQKGRKQYRYHADWMTSRAANKFERLADFAEALPALRQRVKADMALPGLPRPKVLATVVSLLESTLIRVGNEDYAKTNKSYGLTTLRRRHVKVRSCASTSRARAARPGGSRCATGASPGSCAPARSSPARASSATTTPTASPRP
jgi:DNA topoisomerase I